jgi:hypothetical protein
MAAQQQEIPTFKLVLGKLALKVCSAGVESTRQSETEELAKRVSLFATVWRFILKWRFLSLCQGMLRRYNHRTRSDMEQRHLTGEFEKKYIGRSLEANALKA